MKILLQSSIFSHKLDCEELLQFLSSIREPQCTLHRMFEASSSMSFYLKS